MKLLALQQSYASRRSGSFRGGDSSTDGTTSSSSYYCFSKPPSTMFWLLLHGLCCLISLILGFRFSRLLFFLLLSTSSTPPTTKTLTNLDTTPSRQLASQLTNPQQRQQQQRQQQLQQQQLLPPPSKVVVGRHGIRIRPWPHPDPVEVMRAHQIMDRVQREQRAQFGVEDPKTIIVVTPTYVRTFQAMHLTGLLHSLMLAPYDVVWIVVEAGGPTNETASIVLKSGLRVIHIGFNQRMPNSWEDRHRLEAKMRLRALRVVREQKLDGIVMFADDSNMHSMELFDEIQNMKWFGAVSVGILAHYGDGGGGGGGTERVLEDAVEEEKSPNMPLQGPACNASNKLVGWHTFNRLPYEGKNAVYIDDRAIVLPVNLEWAGFVLNSRLLWGEGGERPEWVKDLDSVGEDVESPLSLLKDSTLVEPLGSCGKQVLLWWLRVEARADSKFPPGWIIDPPLEITVPSKRTPWQDAPPELPATEKIVVNVQEQTVRHSSKTRSSRSRRRSKRKHEVKLIDSKVSSKHS